MKLNLKKSKLFKTIRKRFRRLAGNRILADNPELKHISVIFIAAIIVLPLIAWVAGFYNQEEPWWLGVLGEAHGMLFDILILGVLLTYMSTRAEERQKIERYNEEIEDFLGWDEKEATYRIVGNIKRINRLGKSPKNLQNAFLAKANLRQANLMGAELMGANLCKADLIEADLMGADLMGVNLCGTYIWGANLSGADLSKANLRKAELIEANLMGADFREANLMFADLEGADLGGANLEGANLEGANLEGANLSAANLRTASGGRFRRADLRRANLRRADLRRADLTGVDLGGANLEEADLRDANVKDAIFSSNGHGLTEYTKADLESRGAIFVDAPEGGPEVTSP
jgi:BTB/POZ domain-containing protein KCTD9